MSVDVTPFVLSLLFPEGLFSDGRQKWVSEAHTFIRNAHYAEGKLLTIKFTIQPHNCKYLLFLPKEIDKLTWPPSMTV